MKDTPPPLTVRAMMQPGLPAWKRHCVERAEQLLYRVASTSRTAHPNAAKSVQRRDAVHVLGPRALLEVVAVDDHDEVLQAVVGGRHEGLRFEPSFS